MKINALLSLLMAASSEAFATLSSQRTSSTSLNAKLGDSIEFAKYEGLGNDFILIDDRDRETPRLTPEQSERLCNRNFGVGGDGVIFALKAPQDYDFTMRIYNSDGSEPEMCGNGIRCFAQFLKDLGEDAKSYKVNTLAGPIVPEMNPDTITVDMGEPILDGPSVPTTLAPNSEHNSVLEQTHVDKNGKEWKISAVSMGNPHAIIFVDDLEKDIDFAVDGPALESDTGAFPAKTNVEFVQVMSPNHLKMKVWERGAGPTLACGTGTCALVVAAIRANKIPRPGKEGVRVTLPGGDLFIEWREENNRIYMTGPATLSFKGTALLK
ncbi:diaminopimelate epimerase [Thalassiosira pseudonana CCMP1335]|uniref:diaminopimelate epimerase n=1 Tax=Thalassiosira pseudonana TaxID=35128 RepID=B8LBN1_THAPS|nr:diaminopimelate epimerase [Thalassiosira pseudonana CCMP1335]EED87212.1 diaminopimelate epimerase [Thalassiosira pseudonana CCMP1335]